GRGHRATVPALLTNEGKGRTGCLEAGRGSPRLLFGTAQARSRRKTTCCRRTAMTTGARISISCASVCPLSGSRFMLQLMRAEPVAITNLHFRIDRRSQRKHLRVLAVTLSSGSGGFQLGSACGALCADRTESVRYAARAISHNRSFLRASLL